MLDGTGHLVFTPTGSELLCNVAISSADESEKRQTRCAEMQHWDDYRRTMGVALTNGKPVAGQPDPYRTISMMSLFDPHNRATPGSCYRKFSGADRVEYRALSVAVDVNAIGKPEQTFCAEMWHWDEYRMNAALAAGNTQLDGITLMADLFEPFCGVEQIQVNPKDGSMSAFVCLSTALRGVAPSDEVQHYCSEMEHWDDWRQEKSGATTAVQPSMRAQFQRVGRP